MQYTKGAKIVLKFQHSLSSSIQNYIACLTFGCPSDDNPQEWYDPAVLCDENCIANVAFQASLCMAAARPSTTSMTQMHSTTPLMASHIAPFASVLVCTNVLTNPTPAHDLNAMEVDTNHLCSVHDTIICYHCGKTGHTHPNCPDHFDVHLMAIVECDVFIQHELAAFDVCALEAHVVDEPSSPVATRKEVTENLDFATCSE